MKEAVKKLKSAVKDGNSDPRLAFLKKFKYDLRKDKLVHFGAVQSFQAGQVHFERYSNLVSLDNLPFVRASGKDRVIKSATNWTAGKSLAFVFLTQLYPEDVLCAVGFAHHHKFVPVLSTIISESQNDTLDNAMCLKAEPANEEINQWRSIYAPPITTRLNNAAPGAELTDADTHSIISMCPFESVANEALSPFCGLFSEEEFHAYEYEGDLGKFHGTGYGNRLGRVQGVGYVNELLVRLTGKPVQDHTQTNQTLDSSPDTFPLNRTIYADFAHENQMASICSAIGLFPERSLDPSNPDPGRKWVASKLVPFSARMVVEKIGCGDEKEYVRVFVNDALQPLAELCGGGGALDEGDGMCELGAFVASQAYARNDGDGDFEKGFE